MIYFPSHLIKMEPKLFLRWFLRIGIVLSISISLYYNYSLVLFLFCLAFSLTYDYYEPPYFNIYWDWFITRHSFFSLITIPNLKFRPDGVLFTVIALALMIGVWRAMEYWSNKIYYARAAKRGAISIEEFKRISKEADEAFSARLTEENTRWMAKDSERDKRRLQSGARRPSRARTL
jgi:membrane protein implicated in regulation of membrane protease activity